MGYIRVILTTGHQARSSKFMVPSEFTAEAGTIVPEVRVFVGITNMGSLGSAGESMCTLFI